jgi:betaine-aldehyde dehydrogenase
MSPTTVTPATRRHGLFIDGRWREGRTTFTSVNPATEEPVGEFTAASGRDVADAVTAARAAFDTGPWPRLPAAERGRVLRAAARILTERAEDFARAETADTGKPIHESRSIDVPTAADSLDYYGCLVRSIAGAAIPVGDAVTVTTVREPVGVVGAVTPWNFPVVLACRKLGPALAAGNTVVLKPASLAPLTTVMLADVFTAAGLPPGVLNVVTGSGSEAGQALLDDPRIDKLSFTGSTAVGRNVLAATARSVGRCSLELGGKSPAVVLADADLDAAVEGILFGAFLNQGECCCAATRALVDGRVHDDFVARLVCRAAAITVGDPLDETTRLGPLISADHRAGVLAAIDEAAAAGCRVAYGGGVPAGLETGYYVAPTVLDDVPVRHRVARDEIFGPVLPVTAFAGEDALVAAANDTAYGLAASLWTHDLARGRRLADRIRAGTVWINVHNFVFNNAPYGGFKQSGLGRECGPEGFDAYTETKTVMTWVAPEPFRWY